eukprot:CAMPEP_0185840656 /NCGR_PEP_ID=MMETSP1353-20130828/16600_1 /TAXON_ID=1077150 /ORGANISM="Erythrolobus australicus, Strain CCMP3124" /LENGTH=302 /DNA_ID=CAMNT_0028540013 /DNA_START=30 /DNA_END=935 /DNA_ORIENTATION=-
MRRARGVKAAAFVGASATAADRAPALGSSAARKPAEADITHEREVGRADKVEAQMFGDFASAADAAEPLDLPSRSSARRRTMGEARALGEVLPPVLRRLAIWGAFAGLAALFRPFYGVLFGTFVLSYLANSLVRSATQSKLGARIPRRALVSAFYATIVTVLSGISLLTVPRALREGNDFVQSLQSSNPYVLVVDGLRSALGDDLCARIESYAILSMADQPNSNTPTIENGIPPWSGEAQEVLDHIPSSFAQTSVDSARSTKKLQLKQRKHLQQQRKEKENEKDGQAAAAWTEERAHRFGLL